MFLHLSYPRCMNAASSTQTFRLKGNTNLGLAWIYIHFRKNEIDWSTGHIRLNGRSPMYEIHGTKSCIYTWLLWNIHYIYLMDWRKWSKLLAIWYRLTEILPRAKAVSSQITIAINGSKERDSCKLEVIFLGVSETAPVSSPALKQVASYISMKICPLVLLPSMKKDLWS